MYHSRDKIIFVHKVHYDTHCKLFGQPVRINAQHISQRTPCHEKCVYHYCIDLVNNHHNINQYNVYQTCSFFVASPSRHIPMVHWSILISFRLTNHYHSLWDGAIMWISISYDSLLMYASYWSMNHGIWYGIYLRLRKLMQRVLING